MNRHPITIALILCLVIAATVLDARSQAITTGTLTGQVADETALGLPGVTVTILSENMIGGERSMPTDGQGTYRFTSLVPGSYRVRFALDGFQTRQVDEVTVTAGATMTVNGVMSIGSMSETITVTSEAPTIDLEAATVGVTWGSRNLEALPFGKSLPSLVGMIPGLTATQFDVGASTMGGTASPPARSYGRSGGNVTTYDGMVWDQAFGDFGSYDEIQITSAAKGAEAANPGATFNFVIKSGGNRFSGAVLTAWQDAAFQSSNINQRLLDEGLPATSNKYTRYNDIKGELGGPLMRDRLWFYGSYTDSYAGQYISGFVSEATDSPAVFYTRLYGPTAKVTYQPTSTMKLDLTSQSSRKYQPYRGADQFKPLEATEMQDFWVSMNSVKWTTFPNARLTTEVAVNRSGYWWTTDGWTDAVRITDLTTGQIRGTHIQRYRDPSRWQWNGSLSWLPELGGVDHEVKVGFLGYSDITRTDLFGYPNQQLYRYRSLDEDPDFFLRPDSVQVFDYPSHTAAGVMHNSAYLNDRISLTNDLTLNVGVRFDRYSSWLPEQGNPGTGPFGELNVYPERHDFPVYNNISPRISTAYDLFGDGRAVVRASYGRYVDVGSGIQASPGPTADDVNPAATITWTYNNWDGSIPYVPVPADLASTSGGGGTQVLDPDLRAATVDEYTIGTEFGVGHYLMRLNVVHKRDLGGSKTLDLAMPYDAYTEFREAVDPGRDNVEGTADDGVLYAWSVPRTYPGFGDVNRFVTNREDGEGASTYTAYEATMSRRYAAGWSFLLSGTADLGNVRALLPQNPNEAFYNRDLHDWNYSFKVNGTYELPFGLSFATTFAAHSGAHYGRSARMRNALNSTVTIPVEPRVDRYDWVKIWDNRLTRTFQLQSGQSLEASLDFYNTLNSSVVLDRVTVNGPTYLQPNVGSSSAATASAILPPRIFRLGLRWRF